MKKSTVVNFNKNGILTFFNKNYLIILLSCILILGIILGTIFTGNSELAIKLGKASLKQFIAERDGTSFFSIFFASAITSFIFLLVIFLSGASLLGCFLVPLFILYRGFWFGTMTAVLYSEYALMGIAFNAVIIVPSSIIYFICLLLASRESIGFSVVLSKLTLPKTSPMNMYIDFKNYCGRYVFISVIIIISSIVDGVLSSTCMKFFDF